MGPTIGFDTKLRNSFFDKIWCFLSNKNKILTILFIVYYDKITLKWWVFSVVGAHNQQAFYMFKWGKKLTKTTKGACSSPIYMGYSHNFLRLCNNRLMITLLLLFNYFHHIVFILQSSYTTILWSFYDHLSINLWLNYNHIMIILQSYYDYLTIILWLSYNHIMIILQSYYDYLTIIL